MLATNALVRPTSPSLWLANFIARFTAKAPAYPITHGTATYIKSGDTAIHQQTELSFQPGSRETPEAFMWRVWAEAEDGDAIEYRLRDGRITAATIMRKSALPIRMQDGESIGDFVARVKAYKQMPRA